MKIQFLGHGSFTMRINESDLVFDPFISPNPKASHINVESIPADYILITHGHQDHVADVESIASNTNAKLISNFEIVSWFQEKGINGHPMNHGGKWNFEFGTVKYVNAVHSSNLPDGSYGGNPGGFVVWNDSVCFYFAGDTALSMDMKLIPELCPPLDFAILPIGDNFTMGIEEAVMAANFIACNKIIACHFDTFGYIEIDHNVARSAFEKAGKELIILDVGESIEL